MRQTAKKELACELNQVAVALTYIKDIPGNRRYCLQQQNILVILHLGQPKDAVRIQQDKIEESTRYPRSVTKYTLEKKGNSCMEGLRKTNVRQTEVDLLIAKGSDYSGTAAQC